MGGGQAVRLARVRAGGDRISPVGLGAIFAIGLVVRLAVVAAGPDFMPSKDAAAYQQIAENVLVGRGFSSDAPGDTLWRPKSWRTPGYPLYIAAHYWVAGRRAPGAVYVSQALLDAATALLVIFIGRRLFAPRVALLAGFLYALHPLPSLQVATLGTEALAAFCLSLWVLLVYRTCERPTAARAGLAGLGFGLSLLVRPTPQLFLPVAMLLILEPRLSGVPASGGARERPARRRRVEAAAAFVLMALITIAPWAYRNYRVHGALVPLSTLGGVVLNEGVGAVRIGDWWSMPGLHSIPLEDWERWRELGEVEGEKYMRERALAVIRDRPGTFALSVGAKLVRFWLQASAGYGGLSWRSWAVCALQGFTLGLVAIAFLCYRGPWVAAGRLLWLLVLYHSALYSLTVAEVRYGYVLLPLVLLPAALTLERWWTAWWSGERGRRRGPVRGSEERR